MSQHLLNSLSVAKLTVLVLGPNQEDVRATGRFIHHTFGCEDSQSTLDTKAAKAHELGQINDALFLRYGIRDGKKFVSELDLTDKADSLPYVQAAQLLSAQRGAGPLAVLASVDLCSLAVFWNEASKKSGSEAAIVLIASSPPETGTPAELVEWLCLALAAERTTRRLQRCVVQAYNEEHAADWIASTWNLEIRPSGRTSSEGGAPLGAVQEVIPLGFNSWVRRCDAALRQLASQGENNTSYRELDSIQASLDTALAMFAPLHNDHRVDMRRLRGDNARLRAQCDEQRAHIEDDKDTARELEAVAGELAHVRREVSIAEVQARSLLLETRVKGGLSAASDQRVKDTLVIYGERLLKAANRPATRWLKGCGWGYRAVARVERHMAIIADFLDTLPWPVVGVRPDGRRQRILAYLVGATDFLTDFPLVQDVEYGEMYPDVIASGIRPLVHFILHGQDEMRHPHPLFDTHFYVAQCPEAAYLASSPVVHYLKWGKDKKHDPHPLFSTSAYLERYPDVGQSGRNPLLHWLDHFTCTASSLFDPLFYLETYPDVAEAGRNPLTHYLGVGWREGRNPNPWFDTRYYLANNPELAKGGMNPLVHYVGSGWRNRRAPGPLFDPAYYLANDPGLTDDCDPLHHYIVHGRAEGRHTISDKPTPATAVVQSRRRVKESSLTVKAGRIAVMIDAMYPRPDQDSGSLDHVNFVRIFQRLGYEVHFLSLLEFGGDHDHRSAHYRTSLEALGVHCVTSAEYTYFENYYFDESDRINVCFVSRVHFGGMQIQALRRLCPDARIIFNTVDLHFIREEREGYLKNDPALILRACRTRDMELDFAKAADATIVVSSSEKVMLDELAPEARTFVIPLIRQFTDLHEGTFGERQDVAFIGGFNHQPNIDAIEHFLADSWPHVHCRRPDIGLRVIGANMPKDWTRRKVPGVTFVGFVEDLDTELSRLRLTVAPLRYGAGAKGKLVSSLAAGVPAIVSTIASEGMGLVDGDTILVSELGEAFAEKIIQLYNDEALWTRISRMGADFIRKNYSIDSGLELMHGVLTEVGLTPPSR